MVRDNVKLKSVSVIDNLQDVSLDDIQQTMLFIGGLQVLHCLPNIIERLFDLAERAIDNEYSLTMRNGDFEMKLHKER